MKKNKPFVLLILLLLVLSASGQNLKQDLYISHADPGAGAQFRQKIYAYHFVNGTYTGRDEVMSVDGRVNGRDNIRTDKGRNIIYKQRYLVTGIGNIVDLKDKKILFDGRAELVRISNDSAIYYTNDAFKGKYYSVFNFKTLQYGETKNLLFKALLGKDIEFDKTVKPFRMNYYPQGKPKKVITEDAGYGQQNVKDTKYTPDPPKFWLDDSTFIYPKFGKNGQDITVEKVSIESGVIKTLGTTSISTGISPAYWERSGKDLLILHCGGQLHVDLVKGTVTTPAQNKPDNGFSYSLVSDAKGRSLFYNNKEIGKFSFDTENFLTASQVAAAVKMLVIGNEAYQQGLQVYSAVSGQWQKIDAEEVTAILGWVQY